MSKAKPLNKRTIEELESENAKLKELIREASTYPFMSVNLYNLLTKGLNEIETGTTSSRN